MVKYKMRVRQDRGSHLPILPGSESHPFRRARLSSITVRRAQVADLPALGRLGEQLVRVHHDFDPRRFLAATDQTQRGYASFLGTQLDEPSIVVLVAVRDGLVVGYTYA